MIDDLNLALVPGENPFTKGDGRMPTTAEGHYVLARLLMRRAGSVIHHVPAGDRDVDQQILAQHRVQTLLMGAQTHTWMALVNNDLAPHEQDLVDLDQLAEDRQDVDDPIELAVPAAVADRIDALLALVTAPARIEHGDTGGDTPDDQKVSAYLTGFYAAVQAVRTTLTEDGVLPPPADEVAGALADVDAGAGDGGGPDVVI
jgi:hypothetical protein